MESKLEIELETNPRIKENKIYTERSELPKKFNPEYTLMDGSFNVNPLSARSCRCYPCRCFR
jgi:hypothetical protein